MRFFVFLLLILFGIIGYLAILNQGKVTLFLPREVVWDVPIVAFLFFSMAFGGLIVILGVGIRETKNLFSNWRFSRHQKKEERVQELYAEAVNALLAKRYRDSLTLFQKILGLNPNHVNSLLRLGNIHRIEKNYAEAIRLHRKAKNLDEKNREILLALGRDYELSERHEEAIQCLRDVLKLDGGNLTALFYLRDLLVRLERWEEAHDFQEKIMNCSLKESETKRERNMFLGIKHELGRFYTKDGQGEKGRKFFKGAIKMDPSFLPPTIGLAELLLKEKKDQEAAELLEKSFQSTGNIILLHRLEKLYLDLNSPERIIRIYQDAVQRDPNNKILRFYMGKLYYRLEMVDDSFDILAELESADERFPDLHKILGNLYVRRGQLDMAVEEFKKALNLRKMVVIPYFCPLCDFHTADWAGRCQRCGEWNSYIATPILNQRKKEQTEQEILNLSRVSYR